MLSSMLLRKSWNQRRKSNDSEDKRSTEASTFRRFGRREVFVLLLGLWLVASVVLMASVWSEGLDLGDKGKEDKKWCLFGRTIFGKKCHKRKVIAHNHLLHHIDARLSVFLASHAVWEDILETYPAKQKKIWDEVVTDSESDSDTDSEDESEQFRPKRFNLRGNFLSNTNPNIESSTNPVVRRLVRQVKIADTDVAAQQPQSDYHPLIRYLTSAVADIPILDGGISSSLQGSEKSIVVFSTIPSQPSLDSLTYYTVYKYFDDALMHAKGLQAQFPKCVVVWCPPSGLFNSDPDLQLIFHHLTIHYLMERTGLVVIPAVPLQNSLNSFGSLDDLGVQLLLALDKQLSFVYKKLILQENRGDAHALAWHGDSLQVSFVSETIQSLFTNEPHHHEKDQFTKSDERLISLHQHCVRYVNSRKFDPMCMPKPDYHYPLLVTGLGGSGSHFIANQMQDMGYDLRHESIGEDGSVCWFYSVNDYLLDVTYPFGKLKPNERSFLNPRFDHVIHVIRNPLDQISSFTAHTNKTYDFVLHMMEQTAEKSVVQEYRQVCENESLPLYYYCSPPPCMSIGAKQAVPMLSWRVLPFAFRYADMDELECLCCGVLG